MTFISVVWGRGYDIWARSVLLICIILYFAYFVDFIPWRIVCQTIACLVNSETKFTTIKPANLLTSDENVIKETRILDQKYNRWRFKHPSPLKLKNCNEQSQNPTRPILRQNIMKITKTNKISEVEWSENKRIRIISHKFHPTGATTLTILCWWKTKHTL